MSQRKARLARKGARVLAREAQSEYDVALGEARAARDKALHGANEAYRAGLADLAKARSEARAKAHQEYDEMRARIVKRAAA